MRLHLSTALRKLSDVEGKYTTINSTLTSFIVMQGQKAVTAHLMSKHLLRLVNMHGRAVIFIYFQQFIGKSC